MSVTEIPGGITAAAGFRAAGVAAGIKASGALDVTLIVADAPASAAAVFTTNQVQAAPVQVSQAHLTESGGIARAVIVNSGCANACTGAQGLETARQTANAVASLVGCPAREVLVSSTGVIGVHLPADKILAGAAAAFAALGRDGHPAALGIMTTDTFPKLATRQAEIDGVAITINGIAKGAGMIAPDMATMLAFLFTDAAIEPQALRACLDPAVDETFNAVTIDGDDVYVDVTNVVNGAPVNNY